MRGIERSRPHPPRERSLALRAALKRGWWVDALRIGTLPLRREIHGRRRRLQRLLAGTPPVPSERVAGPVAAPQDLTRCLGAARSLFHVQLPPRSSERSFRLAGGRRTEFPEQDASGQDAQDAHAWQRLYWLLETTDARVGPEAERWLDRPLSPEARHPYTTSERICVLAEVLGTRGNGLSAAVANKILGRLRADAAWLYDNTETRLGAHNHLLNNARALHTAARVVGDGPSEKWLDRARALWDEFWPALILDDGVFAEQSSHYHALLTRTLLDYVRDARHARRALPVGLLDRARAMCRVTNALVRPDGTLPLFGDISPDLPTSWLRGLPRVCERAGLLEETPRDPSDGYAAGASAYFRDHVSAAPRVQAPLPDWTSSLFPAGGYLFAANPGLSLELAAQGDPRSTTSCHGDSGRGSFEIWFRGRRIVVDGGIPTYEPGALRDGFRGADGQNVVSIDGVPPALLWDEAGALPPWYLESVEGGAWRSDSTGASFTWHGFRRYQAGAKWVRSFAWSGSRLAIEDRVDGWSGEARIGARLHLGELGWSRRSANLFANRGCEVLLACPPGLTGDLVEMPHATDYGVVVNTQGIEVSGRLTLPAVWSWSFEFDPES